jgi:hypothetical protein
MKHHVAHSPGDLLVTECRRVTGDMNFYTPDHNRAAYLAEKREVTNEPWYVNE